MTDQKLSTKDQWLAANDAGPHRAVLPSGAVVSFRIPNTGVLLRSDAIPQDLHEAAVIFTSHPDGTDEMMRELVLTAAMRGPGQDTIASVIAAGHALTYHLVAAMLDEPRVTAEEIADGLLPELDVRMLLEFAERQRNLDAAGNQLPIVTMDQWATFRRESSSAGGPANGRAPEPVAGEPVPGSDGDAV